MGTTVTRAVPYPSKFHLPANAFWQKAKNTKNDTNPSRIITCRLAFHWRISATQLNIYLKIEL